MSFVISPSVVENLLAYPLTHARIGYDNIVPGSTVTATSAETDWPADAVQRENTFERWQPTVLPATLTIDTGLTGDANYIGIAAHTIGSTGSTLTVESSSDGMAWTAIDVIQPADNRAIMIIFSDIVDSDYRITVSAGSSPPQVGVVFIGRALEMERPIYVGHSPITLSRKTVKRPTKSDKGQWLGSSTVRNGLATGYNWKNLSAQWVRDSLDPFIKNARTKPFFIAWRPADYPSEIGYCWSNQDIIPSNQGPRDLMSVSMSVEGYADE